MKKFLNWMKWEYETEVNASFIFAGLLCIYGLFKLINNEREINIFIMLEMIFLSYFLSVIQRLLFKEGVMYKGKTLLIRTGIWFFIILFSTICLSMIFSWFDGMPIWILVIICIYLLWFFGYIWFDIHYFQKKDTEKLNEMLKDYQNKNESH